MLRVGLTGGIGCGKSSVAAMMRELGCFVIEADRLAHELLEPSQPAYNEVANEFGPEVLDSDGRIDRAKLAEVVFGDFDRLLRLNQIVHPRVIEAVERKLSDFERTNKDGIALVEAALLVEAGYNQRLDRLVVAWCRPEQQLERLLSRGITREQAQRRIAAQMPLEEKRYLAHDVIDCSGSLAETRREVEDLVARLKPLAVASR